MVGPIARGLQAPVLEDLAWMEGALCVDHDPEYWFPPTGGGRDPGSRMLVKARAAKAVCADCPVRTECLTYAFETDQRYGVWGGLDEFERADLATRRRVIA